MRTPAAGALRVTTPFNAKPFTQILPVATQSPISTLAPPLMWAAVSTWHPPIAGIGEITPDGSVGLIDAQFHCDKALDSGMAPAVLSPVGAEDIWLKWRNRRSRRGHWFLLIGWWRGLSSLGRWIS